MSPTNREVLITTPWVPAEWIAAHGLVPRGLFAASQPHEAALAAGICPYAQSTGSMAHTLPDAAIVFTTTCDQLRRSFDLQSSAEPAKSFLLNVPAIPQSSTGRKMFRAELERLGRFLITMGGTTPTATALTARLRDYDQKRRQLCEAAREMNAREYAAVVANFHWTGEIVLPLSPKPKPPNAIPIAIVGGPLDGSHGDILGWIEKAGGHVVLNATETGERSLLPRLSAEGWETGPLGALVSAYLDHYVDVFQRPNTWLYNWLRQQLRERLVRGIVLWHFSSCDLWQAQAQSLKESFGLPLLTLEADGDPGCAAREAGRLQAFLEMLR